jgi:predicted ATPase
VPLHIEELTKAVLEARLRGGASGSEDAIVPTLTFPAVPVSLQDSLMARLDGLGSAKEIAQFASVIGREFPYELLAAIVPPIGERVQEGVRRLVDAELIFACGAQPEGTYRFKHALV